jgi:hypothetical protein
MDILGLLKRARTRCNQVGSPILAKDLDAAIGRLERATIVEGWVYTANPHEGDRLHLYVNGAIPQDLVKEPATLIVEAEE